MAMQLARRLDAEVLVMCAIEWHPRYGGAEDAEAVRRDVKALVEPSAPEGCRRAER
jgi:hypothetical protein